MNHSRVPPSVDDRHRFKVLRLAGGALSLRLDVCATRIALVLLCLAMAMALMISGDYPIALSDVVRLLAGSGVGEGGSDADPMLRMVVLEWRLPRVLLAFLLGAALGMSGAIFQSLTRNPLGSPDVIGFAAGSYSGALVVIVMLSGGYYQTAAGALIGGIVTAMTVYLLAWRRGVQGFRLIVVGIGIAAMLGAFNAWMIREAQLQVAMSAAIWGAGSLNGLGFEQLVPIAILFAVLMLATLWLARPMRQLELGDDIARACGVDVTRTRLALMVLGVALTATVTAAAGPIAFIALAAPQLARRLGSRLEGRLPRSAAIALIPSALTGALLLMTADWAAQHAFGIELPVGVMTVSIGGIYFLWLLIREGRT
jgi:iron complex transport system permease protein